MKSKSIYLVGLTGLGILGLASACQTTINNGSGGATTSTSTGTTSAVTTGKGVTSTATGTGGAGSGNHSFDTATDLTVNDTNAPATNTLVDAMTADYYKFTGTKGERVTTYTQAQSLAMANPPTDATITDTVITVFDSTKTAIAQDDDMWPGPSRDSQAWVTLPADGTYYLKVEDCNSALGAAQCADATGIVTFDYTISVADVNKLIAPEVFVGATNTPATAAPIAYALPSGNTAGDYGEYILDGGFTTASDTAFYSFTPKPDTTVDTTSRARAEFWVQPISATNGDGSASNVTIQVIDQSNLDVLAEIDQTNYTDGDNLTNGPADLSVPVTLGHSYYVKVTPTSGATDPLKDYYYMSHFVGSYYFGQVEKADLTNGLVATAEVLQTPPMVTAGAYFVDGDLSPAATDTDWYTMAVPTGNTVLNLYCDAQRAGSGLRGANFTVWDATGTTQLGGFTEDKTKTGGIGGPMSPNCLAGGCDIMLPANTTAVTLKVTAASQDTTVTGTYYHCDIIASKP